MTSTEKRFAAERAAIDAICMLQVSDITKEIEARRGTLDVQYCNRGSAWISIGEARVFLYFTVYDFDMRGDIADEDGSALRACDAPHGTISFETIKRSIVLAAVDDDSGEVIDDSEEPKDHSFYFRGPFGMKRVIRKFFARLLSDLGRYERVQRRRVRAEQRRLDGTRAAIAALTAE